jgi:hypothetical protein
VIAFSSFSMYHMSCNFNVLLIIKIRKYAATSDSLMCTSVWVRDKNKMEAFKELDMVADVTAPLQTRRKEGNWNHIFYKLATF